MSPENAPSGPKAPHPGLKLALELGPVLLFFVVFLKVDIFWATGVFMVTSVVSLAYTWFTQRRVAPMVLITTAMVLVLGGLTIWLQDETFIKMKLTLVNVVFGSTLLIGAYFKKHLIQYVLGEALQLSDRGWEVITKAWIGFFFGMAALNEVVWRNTSTDTWVKFKTFGVFPLTLVFFIALAPVLSRHELSTQESDSAEE